AEQKKRPQLGTEDPMGDVHEQPWQWWMFPVAKLPVAPVGDALNGIELQVSLQHGGNDRPNGQVNEGEDAEASGGGAVNRPRNPVSGVTRPCRGRYGIHPCASLALKARAGGSAPAAPAHDRFGGTILARPRTGTKRQ